MNQLSTMLVPNPRGNYRFLQGIGAYSSGVVADPGYEIVHVTLASPLAVRPGFEIIARHLGDSGRPRQALCAVELRSPRPFSFEGFAAFNESYREILTEADMLLDGLNPIARTNVAPEVSPPMEPTLYAFSYTAPARGSDAPPAFAVAGAGELAGDQYDRQHIVRVDDTSEVAMRKKAQCVMDHMQRRLEGLGVGWAQVNVVNIYTVQDIAPFLRGDILARLGDAARHGVRWHYARPPIEGLEFEMDVRAVGIELQR